MPVDTQIAQTTAVEFGIACESCHSPSAAHVAANSSLARRYRLHLTGAADATVVQPARLDPARGSQVCGQCHSVWEFYDGAGERAANDHGLPYRPGDDLTATRFVAQPTRNMSSPTMQMLLADDARFIRDAFWSDGTVRVSGREYNGLIESPCFKNATTPERTLSCFSCHTLHRPDDDPAPAARVGGRSAHVVPARTPAIAAYHVERRRVSAVSWRHAIRLQRPYAPRGRLRREPVPQLPHAVHDLRPSQDDSQPHDRIAERAREHRHRPAERVQPVSLESNARVDCRCAEGVVRHRHAAGARC
ncbi:MAG: hypothetical protein QM736_21000 [Vicinamibacterales bacterium]